MEYKEECLERTRNKIIVCEENKRKIIFYNNNARIVEKIKVDGCQITEGVRCDYLVNFAKIHNFIELKGKDIKHAKEQIVRTMKVLSKKNYEKRCYIVSSRSPSTSPNIQNLKLEFKNKYNANLYQKNNIIEVVID